MGERGPDRGQGAGDGGWGRGSIILIEQEPATWYLSNGQFKKWTIIWLPLSHLPSLHLAGTPSKVIASQHPCFLPGSLRTLGLGVPPPLSLLPPPPLPSSR